MAAGIIENDGKRVGSTTKGATAGSGIAGAVAVIVAYVLTKTGVEGDPVVAATLGAAVATLLASVGALLGGKVSPTDKTRTIWGSAPAPAGDLATPPAGAVVPVPEPVAEPGPEVEVDVVIPDGTGSHRAADPVAELNAEVDKLDPARN